MLRAKYQSGHRPRPAALMAAVLVCLAVFSLVCLILKPGSQQQTPLSAAARLRGFADNQFSQREVVMAALLSPERLRSAIREARLATDHSEPELVRDRLRIDLGSADEAGVQTITIRWTGPASPAAGRLVNILAGRLSQMLTAGDAGALEAAYATARQAAREASRSLNEIHRRLELAAAPVRTAAQQPAMELAPAAQDVEEPRLAPPHEPGLDGRSLLAQQLNDLESRRQTLLERLMPEHPEMKSLDAKIEALRSRLSDQPPPAPVADTPQFTEPGTRRGLPPVDIAQHAVNAQITKLADELVTAQARYETAAANERAAWQALCAARNASLIEIEPAAAVFPPSIGGWQKWLTATFCGLLSSALLLLLWPVRRQTFSTADEVRAVTRLPVVAVSRHSLN